jgi:hypothetical protein
MADRPQFELELDFTSPYKATRLFIKAGRAFFGIWRPLEVKLEGDEEEVIIEHGLEGQLDLIADAVYGDRRLWRVIAHANQIDRPFEQVTIGMHIKIPKLANVRAALLATAGRQQTEDE